MQPIGDLSEDTRRQRVRMCGEIIPVEGIRGLYNTSRTQNYIHSRGAFDLQNARKVYEKRWYKTHQLREFLANGRKASSE
jgi:hypothetical protein